MNPSIKYGIFTALVFTFTTAIYAAHEFGHFLGINLYNGLETPFILTSFITLLLTIYLIIRGVISFKIRKEKINWIQILVPFIIMALGFLTVILPLAALSGWS